MKILGFILMSGAIVACTPSAKRMEKLVADNPQIVFKAIESKPVEFFDVVRQAEQKARAAAQQKQQQQQADQRAEEFKNPKQPVVEADRAVFGPKDAAITVVEYSDFQCGYCSRAHNTMKQLREKYGDKVRLVYKHLPFQRPYARVAAEYFEAIALQGAKKAEKFHDHVFENQGELRSKGEAFLKTAARRAGANVSRIAKDRKSDKVQKRIEADMAEATKFGFAGTPGFLVNGITLKGAQPLASFVAVIDDERMKSN